MGETGREIPCPENIKQIKKYTVLILIMIRKQGLLIHLDGVLQTNTRIEEDGERL